HPPRGPRDRRSPRPRHRGPRRGADVPEHPPLQQPERARQPPRRRARAPARRRRGGARGGVSRPPWVRAEEKDAVERALEVLGLFGNRLLPRLDHPAYGLSYAHRRPPQIARALIAPPK